MMFIILRSLSTAKFRFLFLSHIGELVVTKSTAAVLVSVVALVLSLSFKPVLLTLFSLSLGKVSFSVVMAEFTKLISGSSEKSRKLNFRESSDVNTSKGVSRKT